MTNILELLKNEKVEWKKLGEIKEITVVTPKTKLKKIDYKPEGKYPIIDQGQEFIVGYTNEESVLFDLNEYVIFGDHTESVKYVDFRFAQGADGIKVLRADNKYIKSRYLYHAILSFYEQKKGYMRHFSLLKQTEIPIPSPETQEKIVEILDKFTNYVTELQSELQSRTKQYTYYRDMLLSEEYLNKITKEMEDDRRLSTVKLEEVVTIKNGKDWKKLEKGAIPVYGSGGEMGVYVDEYSYDKSTVLIPRKGSIENVFYLDKPFWNVDIIFYTEIDESKLIPKYFYYFIEQYDLSKLSDNPTRPSLTQSTLNKLIMNLPSLSLQNKIVKVLDKFQLLLEDTKGFLPEEIEQRQKQYEYYREKLLTFDIDSDSTHARTIISNLYYDILYKAAELVEVDIKDRLEWKKLENICEIIAGGDVPKLSMSKKKEGEYIVPIVSNGIDDKSIYGWTNIKKINKPSITISARGTIGWANIILEPFYPVVRLLVLTPIIQVNIKYIYYLMKKKETTYILPKSGIPQLTKPMVSGMVVPIPPLHVQQHIVAILDKFDTLVNDIKEGLPKEIEQRQKQYEYWREQLLSFSLE